MPKPSGASYKTVRGLARGLDVLRALNTLPGGEGGVERLSALTTLHRTTVRRLLDTLCREGFVRKSPSDDSFRLTIGVRALSEGFTDEAWISQVGASVLGDLMRQVVWPTDLCTPDGDSMVIRETTHRFSPLSFHRSMVGVRLPMLSTAVGRAYLAFCPAEERGAILKLVHGGRQGGEGLDLSRWVEALLERTRADGYGSMDRERTEEPGVSAIAVPIRQDRRVAGCLNLIYRGQAMTVSEAAERFLPALNNAASRVSQEIGRKSV